MLTATVTRVVRAAIGSGISRRSIAVSHHDLAVAALFLLMALPAAAQGVSTASIVGRVVDQSGAALPGVTVVCISPALQVAQIAAVTDQKGEYRLVELPLGVYDITYSLEGFQGVKREGIRLTAGFVAKIDESLKLASFEETLIVRGQSPIVDVTSTTTRTQFLKETLDAIPTSRNSITSLLLQSPGMRSSGVDVGGSQTGLLPKLVIFGRMADSAPMIEGVLGRESTGSSGGSYYDYMTFEEAVVQTFAHSAETGSSGAVFNAIVKSGGNDFHGTYWASQVSPRFQSNNIDDKLKSQGVTSGNPLITRWDVSGDLGGRMVRDKVWFYAAGRRQRNDNEVIGLLKPDGTPGNQPNDVSFLTGKGSYQINAGQKLIVFTQRNKKHLLSGGSAFVPWESRYNQTQPGANSKVEWTGVFGSSVVGSLQYGNWWYNSQKTGFSEDIATFDIVTLKYTGLGISSYLLPGYAKNWRHDFKGNLSILKKNWLHGDHNLKIGWESHIERRTDSTTKRPNGDYSLQFRSGVPYRLLTYNNPVEPLNANNWGGAYAQDSWTISRNLTLDLGVRFDRFNMFIPEQSREAGQFAPAGTFPKIQFNVWNAFVPRVHFAYDVTGKGATVIKGGWGRFNQIRTAYEPEPWNPNAKTTTTYEWKDLNGNRKYDAGEVNLDPNGSDFVSRSAGTSRIVNPDEEQPKLDEFTGSFEHQLVNNMAVRISGVYSRKFNQRRLLNLLRPYSAFNIPITNPDPGPDGRVGTVDDPGTYFTYFDYPASLRGLQFQREMSVNDPNYVDWWKSVEAAFSKRSSNNWQLQASFSLTKRSVRFPTTSEEPPVTPLDPNIEINSRDETWGWVGKASAAYWLPWKILSSANFQHMSGEPYTRQVLFSGGTQIASIVVNVEPSSAHRMPSVNTLDVRVEKTFPLGRGSNVAIRGDLFNVLNTNAVLALNQRSGSTFEQPTTIVPPRVAMFGASFTF